MSEFSTKHRHFWYVSAYVNRRPYAFAVASTSSEGAARLVKRKHQGAKVQNVTAVEHSHVWLIDHKGPSRHASTQLQRPERKKQAS